MAAVNYGRIRPTPSHVRVGLSAAWGTPPDKPGKRSPGVAGLGPLKPVPGMADFGKKPGKKLTA